MATAALAKVQVALPGFLPVKIAGFFLMFFGAGSSGDGFRAFPRDKRQGCCFFLKNGCDFTGVRNNGSISHGPFVE